MNYLSLLSAHYECDGTAGLLDSVASANYSEQNTVALDADGKLGTARGPCSGNTPGGNGFSITASGVYDTRHSAGFRLGTQMGWFRIDSSLVTQEFSSQARATSADNTQQYVVRCSQQLGGGNEAPIMLVWDHTLNNFGVVSGPGRGGAGIMPLNTWCMIGWSVNLNTDVLNFFAGVPGETPYFLPLDLSGISAFRATVIDANFLGLGSGFSTGGTQGDIDQVDWYNGFFAGESDFLYFWNNGSARAYPEGYISGPNGITHHVRARAKNAS